MSRATSIRSATPILLLLALVLAAAINLLYARGQESGDGDIADGLSDSEEDQLYRSISDQAERTTFQRVREFEASGGRPETLRRVSRLAVASAPVATIDEAIRQADSVIVGEVTRVQFAAAPQSQLPGYIVRVRVTENIGGEKLDGEVLLQHPGTIEIDPASGELLLGESDYAPILFEGDRALLLIRRVEGTPYFTVLPWVGEYREVDGVVRASPGNPFGSGFDGKPMADVIRSHQEAVARVK